jgi:N-ethylmaleimide reductase
MTINLFGPLMMGDLSLPNRIVMAPLTRNRALHEGDVPHELMALYYAQRASAGLIISEGVQISPEGKGYAWTPGIHSPEQVNGWQLVTQAVHDHGGRIFAQIWHVGRVSHSSLQPHNQAPVAPSAIAAKAHVFNGEGFVPTSTPRALNIEDIARVIEDYRLAAVNAKAAGFDGIELHAANGYLIDQFLRDDSNKRTDAYGGSQENRTRLLVEILDVLATVWPAKRIGVRFSPFSSASGAADSNPQATFEYAIAKVNDFGLAYLHLVEGETGGARDLPPGADLKKLRACFSGVYMANNGYNLELAQQAIASGAADLIAFGRPFISNPDLVERLRQNAPLTPPDQKTFYGGGAEGYTDYPCLNDEA